jgi:hypothetical protein
MHDSLPKPAAIHHGTSHPFLCTVTILQLAAFKHGQSAVSMGKAKVEAAFQRLIGAALRRHPCASLPCSRKLASVQKRVHLDSSNW